MTTLWRAAILAGVVATLAPVTAQQRPTFTARKDIVRVDALVTDAGQVVRGLTAEDFEVFDNGVRQQVELMSADDAALDAILALDLSGSVAGESLGHLRRAGNAVLDALGPREQAALITFSHSISLGVGLTKDRGRVRDVLESAHGSGDTALIDASYAALVLGEADTGRALVIVFSDGLDTSSWLTAASVLDTARRASAVVYTVSVGGLPRVSFLRDLSAATGGTLFEVDSTKDLDALFIRVLNEFRQRYLVSYSPSGVSKDGWHRLDVRVKNRPNLVVKARPGYQAG
jgi:Ca-activated chloride channel family protein